MDENSPLGIKELDESSKQILFKTNDANFAEGNSKFAHSVENDKNSILIEKNCAYCS